MSIHDVVCAVGVSYKNLPLNARELFSLGADRLRALYAQTCDRPFFVLSTCNRTEIYGFDPDALVQQLTESDAAKSDLFTQFGYVLHGNEAVHHLHRVSAGLESQVPGDYEIVGQVRAAWRMAREAGCADAVLERLVDSSIRASRRVRQETRFSTGTTSVAHVAVQEVAARFAQQPSSNVAVYGAGKIGRAVVRGLLELFTPERICVLNRTERNLREHFGETGVRMAGDSALRKELLRADALVVATGASGLTVREDHFGDGTGPRLLIDLSVPRNIDPKLGEGARTLMNVDELSVPVQRALRQREAEIPAVEAIAAECAADFLQWHEARRLSPLVQALQSTFQDLQSRELRSFAKHQPDADPEVLKRFSDRLIEKFSRRFMHRLKTMPADRQTSRELLSAMLDVDLQDTVS